jgi:hypothetical protein
VSRVTVTDTVIARFGGNDYGEGLRDKRHPLS